MNQLVLIRLPALVAAAASALRCASPNTSLPTCGTRTRAGPMLELQRNFWSVGRCRLAVDHGHSTGATSQPGSRRQRASSAIQFPKAGSLLSILLTHRCVPASCGARRRAAYPGDSLDGG